MIRHCWTIPELERAHELWLAGLYPSGIGIVLALDFNLPTPLRRAQVTEALKRHYQVSGHIGKPRGVPLTGSRKAA